MSAGSDPPSDVNDPLQSRHLIKIPTSDLVAQEQARGWGGPKVTTPPAELADLITSIHTSGLLQPILCEQLPDGRLVPVSGHRRLAACKWGWTHLSEHPNHHRFSTVPAIVVNGPLKEEHRRRVQLVENLSRKALQPGELAAGLLYGRAAILSERLTEAGFPPPKAVVTVADPVERWEGLNQWRIDNELWHVGAPWPTLLHRLGIDLPMTRCKQLAAAFRHIPKTISTEMDASQVALATRQKWMRLWKGRDQAAEEIWAAVKERDPKLLARAVREAETDPARTADEAVEAAAAFHEAADQGRSKSQRHPPAAPPVDGGGGTVAEPDDRQNLAGPAAPTWPGTAEPGTVPDAPPPEHAGPDPAGHVGSPDPDPDGLAAHTLLNVLAAAVRHGETGGPRPFGDPDQAALIRSHLITLLNLLPDTEPDPA